jgi:hypothetical protein
MHVLRLRIDERVDAVGLHAFLAQIEIVVGADALSQQHRNVAEMAPRGIGVGRDEGAIRRSGRHG